MSNLRVILKTCKIVKKPRFKRGMLLDRKIRMNEMRKRGGGGGGLGIIVLYDD